MEEPRSAWMVSWPGQDDLLLAGFLDQLAGESSAFARGDHPADDIAAEDVQDDVEVKVGPLGGAA